MKTISPAVNCPLCHSETRFISHAVLAPWICELAKLAEAPKVSLHSCDSCGMSSFSYRYSDAEMSSLYNSYRKSLYLSARNRWEPWFGGIENNAFNSLAVKKISERSDFLTKTLKDAGLEVEDFIGCIDFGGDLGQFIPTTIRGPKIVVDYSEKGNENPEIVFFKTLAEVNSKVDLVLSCHVLEHMPDLNRILEEISIHLNPDGHVYVEVPQDFFSVSNFHRTSIYFRYLAFVSKSRKLFVALDFLSGVYRQLFKRIPWFGIVKQSEHLNYFNHDSLRYIFETSGYRVIHISKPDRRSKQGKIRLGRIAAIGRLLEAQPRVIEF